MHRTGFGMKNKLSNILRSSCKGLKHRPPSAVADVGFAQFSSLATENSLISDFSKRVARQVGGNSVLHKDQWIRQHALVYQSPFQLAASGGQHMSSCSFARSFASKTTESNRQKEQEVREFASARRESSKKSLERSVIIVCAKANCRSQSTKILLHEVYGSTDGVVFLKIHPGNLTRKDLSTVEDPFDSPTYNIPEKPVTFTEGASYTLVILAGLGIAAAAAYGVFKELIFEPKEYKIFNKALERIQNDSQVRVRIGSPITGYGSESRNRAARQRVPNKTWTDEDGVEHIVVNFHIRGPHGAGKVYSEMFKDKVDKQWKFMYLIVEVTSPSPAQLMLESYVPA